MGVQVLTFSRGVLEILLDNRHALHHTSAIAPSSPVDSFHMPN